MHHIKTTKQKQNKKHKHAGERGGSLIRTDAAQIRSNLAVGGDP
jgi:hypothetical protein